MIAETDPRSPIAAAFDLIGRTVTGRADVKRQKKQSMFGSLFKKSAKKAS
jgi:Flp pilus assembly CpaE family ATPase